MARPLRTFGQFVGQTQVVQLLRRLIAGALALGRPCPSLQIIAPAGHGKTAIARAIAQEYGSNCHPFIAGKDTRASDICDLLLAANAGDVVLIDEAHSLGLDAQQVLFTALDQSTVPGVTDKGRLNRSKTRSLAAITIILATNQPGRLKPALRSRLVRIEFSPYTTDQLKVIAECVATSESIEITPQAARWLAEVGQGSPRMVARRVEALRLFFPADTKLGSEHVEELLRTEGVDEFGLWPLQRFYLQTLAASRRGTCALERLAVTLGCDSTNIRQDVEMYLIERGWVEAHAGRGRIITDQGRAIVHALSGEQGGDSSC